MKLNIVPAKNGLLWVKQGIRTFWRQPLAFTGLFFLFMAWVSVLSMVPVLGAVLALLILPCCYSPNISQDRTNIYHDRPSSMTRTLAVHFSPESSSGAA